MNKSSRRDTPPPPTSGVLLTVSGQSCVFRFAGLSNAAANTWPMVMISGFSDQSFTGRGAFQELNQIAAVKPYSKFAAVKPFVHVVSRDFSISYLGEIKWLRYLRPCCKSEYGKERKWQKISQSRIWGNEMTKIPFNVHH
ncbi:2-hydroxyacyl-coa lyase [Phtheirospermum japonicum]|uniref:2-hydroxyacyl-coa lyase n=1 Tax=Phtheirospermum japonicum TaxID=374723 RepID=A0A830BW86_9LAMI|nr:2-hydroxyacyl-coa lyase [Phtheirospermum japonicum]